MKIAQMKYRGDIRLASVEGDTLRVMDFDGSMIDWIRRPKQPVDTTHVLQLRDVEWVAPVSSPSKIIAIGLNYRDHAQEGMVKVPESPLIFCKFPNSLIGAGKEICWSRSITRKVDFEAELAVVIGKTIFGVSETDAMGAVFGYTCANDVSARDLQFGDTQWVRGKSLNTFCPLGPWIVTADEITDPQALGIRSWLNSRVMQESNTRNMIFSVAHLVWFAARHFTLYPGDVILTGTPSGVGVFRNPPIFMADGDEIVVEIAGIGKLKNRCRETP
jgi:2-keto-4-pentenoate hydratase/2-oxohepta-3-ene-1,7-dioic acid hydratase in catechol pathway